MKKINLLICLLIAVSMLAGCVSKEPMNESEREAASYEYIFRDLPEPIYIETAESFSGGSGTEKDPYQISTAAELALMAELTNDEDSTASSEYNKANYKLTADISLNDTSNAAEWGDTSPEYSWKAASTKNPFTGSFDGNGHIISGLYINADYSDNNMTHNYFGLFAQNYGNISNLKLTDSYICVSGYSSYIGSICGINYGSIINCESSVNLEYYDATIGGIAGMVSQSETINDNGGVISDCTFSGNIKDKRESSNSNAGGIVGSVSSNAQIKNCRNYADISADYENSNIIAGIAASCSDSTVDGCINSGNISGNGEVGGVVGVSTALRNDEITSIMNCVNEGTIHGRNRSISGILASNGGTNTKISGCKNNGEVSVINKSDVFAAGIVAETGKGSLTIENCENSAYVSSDTPAGIIAQITSLGTLDLEVKNCINSGKIVSTGIYSGGIINNVMPSLSDDTKITVIECTNKGDIESNKNAGGILAFLGNVSDREVDGNSSLNIVDCTNEGNIQINASTAFVGGIMGVHGMQNFHGEITGCMNKGTITFTEVEPDKETTSIPADDSQRALQLTRMGGGIVGKIGAGTDLAQIRGEDNNNSNINADDVVLKISDCRSTGVIVSPAEEDYVYEDNGEPVIINDFGGIVGHSSPDGGYAFKAENCFYSGTDCGLGNNYGTDIGTKEN